MMNYNYMDNQWAAILSHLSMLEYSVDECYSLYTARELARLREYIALVKALNEKYRCNE